jgi:predicted RNA-binding protein YlxR (DUF448 family)
MTRIVRTPDGAMMIDHGARRPGRGAYLCRTAECVRTATEKGTLTRALHVATPPELEAELGTMIEVNEGGGRGQE